MTGFSRSHISHIALAIAASMLFPGCTGTYKKWSDHEVFGILKHKSSLVPNADDSLLCITPPNAIGLEKLKKNLKTEEFLGDSAKIEKNARVITLADSLGYAVERNRAYLSLKETVYLTTLDLTLARHEFGVIPYAAGSGAQVYKNSEHTVITAPAVPAVPATATTPGTPAIPAQTVNKWITDHTQTATGSVGFSALGRAGTKLAADLTSDFFQFIGPGSKGLHNSRLGVSLMQPVLRGAGVLSAYEPVTQAERDVLYNVRTFTQYRKTFAIDTATQFYQTLQSRDEVKNSFTVYRKFNQMITEQAALVDATRPGRTKSALGLLRQAELTYHRRWITAIKTYEENLDDLKIQLGVPVTEPIILDQAELDKLTLIDPAGTMDEAMATALDSRLDLWNAKDTLEDAKRHVKVAEQDCLPGLGLSGKYNLVGDKDDDGLTLNRKRRDYSVGLDLDLHLDQKPSRNKLREAQIEQQRAERLLDLAQENVRKEIRASWRNLQLARKQYDLAQEALKLSEGRMELEQALYAADRGTSRDLIDAQTALIDARNQITAALVSHTIARIQLYKDMGVLFIRKDGAWADVLKKESPKGNKP
jgi:hypothetical protein